MNETSGLELTLRTLERSVHATAVDVLAAATSGPDESLRERAAATLIVRGGPRAAEEFVRCSDSLPDGGIDLFDGHRVSAGRVLEGVLRNGTPADRLRALEIVRRWNDDARLDAILTPSMAGDEALLGPAIETVESLVERLFELRTNLENVERTRAAGHQIDEAVRSALRVLLAATRKPELELFHETAVRSILVLGTSHHVEFRELLWDAVLPIRDRAIEVMRHDEHPGVVELLLDCLASAHPHPAVFECAARRTDRPFVEALLTMVDEGVDEAFADNLSQITKTDWFAPEYVDDLPPELQRPAVRLLDLLPTSDEERQAFLDWVTRDGSGEARGAASDHLDRMPAERVNEIVSSSLEDEDSEVRAWATSQLRPRSIPNNLLLLIERLDDPEVEVREAARHGLAGFNFELLLRIHPALRTERARQAGRLLVKIDEHVDEKLRAEFTHPQRSRRVRALQATAALDLAPCVEADLLPLLSEDDPVVRRIVADVLRDAGPGALPALHLACSDSNRRVAEAAAAAIASIVSRESHAASNEHVQEVSS